MLGGSFFWIGAPEAQSQGIVDPWALLARPDSMLRKDIVGSEWVLDLVQPWVADSIVEERRQRLKGFGGWIIQRAAARYWQHYTDHKQKYVASSSRPYHIFNGPGDEIDINIFLMPHLPKYVAMVKTGFEQALERNRSENGFRFDQPPGYPVPEELKYLDRGYLSVECEVTPPQKFADLLEDAFLPVHEGVFELDSIETIGVRHPSMGMTGVWCMDCNHNCRPEIHPIEWIWWLDMSGDRPGSALAKSWMVALMVDDSHRFQDWSSGPLSGEIAIPFAVPREARTIVVDLQNICGDPISVDSMVRHAEGIFQSADTSFVIPYIPGSGISPKLDLLVRTSGNWPLAGTQYWFSDVQSGANGWTGYLHIATTVQSLLAMRVTVDAELD